MSSPTEGYVHPKWAYSAVCPGGYDYVAPWCKLHGYAGPVPEGYEPPRQPGEAMVQRSEALVGQAWMMVDGISTKANMAMIGSGLALIIAFAALLTSNLKPRGGGR